MDWRLRYNRATGASRGLPVPTDLTRIEDKTLAKQQGLRKHESSLLVQIRTGRIGLRAFLFQRGVPDISNPLCSCGTEPETPDHLVLRCPESVTEGVDLAAILGSPLRTRHDVAAATENNETEPE